MKFTFRGFSGEMPPSLLTFSEPEEHCSRFWFISSNTDAGDHPCETGVEGQSLTAEDQLFILMQAALYLTATRGVEHPRREFVTSARSPCVIRSIVRCSCMWR